MLPKVTKAASDTLENPDPRNSFEEWLPEHSKPKPALRPTPPVGPVRKHPTDRAALQPPTHQPSVYERGTEPLKVRAKSSTGLDSLFAKLKHGSSAARALVKKQSPQHFGTAIGRRLGESLLKDYRRLGTDKERREFTRSLRLYPTMAAKHHPAGQVAGPVKMKQLRLIRKRVTSETKHKGARARRRADLVLEWVSPTGLKSTSRRSIKTIPFAISPAKIPPEEGRGRIPRTAADHWGLFDYLGRVIERSGHKKGLTALSKKNVDPVFTKKTKHYWGEVFRDPFQNNFNPHDLRTAPSPNHPQYRNLLFRNSQLLYQASPTSKLKYLPMYRSREDLSLAAGESSIPVNGYGVGALLKSLSGSWATGPAHWNFFRYPESPTAHLKRKGQPSGKEPYQFEFTETVAKYGDRFLGPNGGLDSQLAPDTNAQKGPAAVWAREEFGLTRKFHKLPVWKFKTAEYPKRNLVPFLDLEGLSYENKF